LDHLRRRTLGVGNVRYLVLDEADEMLSMGFEKEITAIIEQLPTDRQTMLFSATIPAAAQRLAQRFMKEPTVISLSDDYVGAKEIKHSFYMISGSGRLNDLVKILDIEDPESAMIFCNTREDVQVVASALKRYGFGVDWISSDLSQTDREKAMGRMRKGDARFLVATDVAARGIDISHVTHVINYTFPEALEVYIHRTGRTGRMGRIGWAVSLITPRDVGNLYFLKLTYKITPIERELPTRGDLEVQQESDLLATLITDYRDDVDERLLSLARRVLHHAHGTEIVATLLGKYLLETPEAATIGESARRDRQGSPAFKEGAPARRRPSGREQRGADSSSDNSNGARSRPQRSNDVAPPPSDDEPTTSEGVDDSPDQMEFKEIYLNVGRRDGVRSLDIVRLLEGADINRGLIDKIRIRDRSTFIAVRADLQENALSVLNGSMLGSRVTLAEPAKRARS
jgi:ATP-dependent RNA helicase DeaD